MTALPVQLAPQPQPMTAAEYAATPETPDHRFELQEGAVVMPAGAVPAHQDALAELYVQVRVQTPPHLKVLLEVDLDLHLVPPTQPGTVRVPDLVVVTREAFARVGRQGGLLRADDAVLAVELHSTSTKRTDTVVKHSEYADSGIGHYWMIDLLDGPSLTACHHGGPFGYVDAEPVRGTFTADAPFPVRLDLDQLG
ncbi:MAG: Uma2 family endonuclease [Pseudonocardia sp.]|uniref:Uma2 family endonuclease n=1 Tax=Pseudonocardia sp. TaxID=60912 RepID=UPI001AD0D0E1|nr:Uma2 family endonuclease [Pseudonocardia sp.]MBN9101294.1 Uma2 family endonuclease [Pseudonocardia sp.]